MNDATFTVITLHRQHHYLRIIEALYSVKLQMKQTTFKAGNASLNIESAGYFCPVVYCFVDKKTLMYASIHSEIEE